MPTIRANGIDIRYDVQGEGPPLVLSHSLACDLSMWDEQAAALAASYRVIRYDTRGHGGSTPSPAPYTLDLLADDLLALMDALGVQKAHFAGLSMGGMIGQTCALAHPERFSSLILCDTTSRYPPEAAGVWEERVRMARTQGMQALVEPTLARWFTEPFRKRNPAALARFAKLISSTPLEGYTGCSRAIVKIDVSERLKGLRLPALVIVGEQDPGTPVAMAREIHEHLPGSQLAVIPEAAHISNVEQPEAFTRLVLDFLERNAR